MLAGVESAELHASHVATSATALGRQGSPMCVRQIHGEAQERSHSHSHSRQRLERVPLALPHARSSSPYSPK